MYILIVILNSLYITIYTWLTFVYLYVVLGIFRWDAAQVCPRNCSSERLSHQTIVENNESTRYH